VKRRLGFLSWIVVALVLLAAIYVGVVALKFLYWGPGYAGSLAGRHTPQVVRVASRVYVYDHVIVVERDRVVFRRAMWASARFAAFLGFVTAIVMGAIRKRGSLVLLMALAVAGTTFGILRSRARDVVLPRGSPRAIVVQGDDVVDAATAQVLLRLQSSEGPDARFWRDLVAEKIAARP
jgi:hypothetical protein